jgi:thiamine-monophosphate kinase
MKIQDIGGEFALIDRLSRIASAQDPDLIAGIGDDAAVIRVAPEPAPYLLVTTDMLVAQRHFNTQWATAEQIGIKAAECNVSDIAAMGGTPTWMFISLVLAKETTVEWAEGLYRGLTGSCQQHGVVVAGGDTTQGMVDTINITLLGSVPIEHLCLRSHARPGDLLMVTGPLGASAAGLALLTRNQAPSAYLRQKHLAPTCRLDAAGQIAPLVNAMIDISDGLGSEVHHMCQQSGVGALVEADRIPLHVDVQAAGKALGIDPHHFALSGGEDFELLFSISPDKADQLAQTGVAFHQIGEIPAKKNGPIFIRADGSRVPLPGGYDHFR